MINHVRNLLMNVSSSSQSDLPGEEYVPADFRPRLLTPAAAAARRILFGSNPDRLYLNYRLREYMTLLHVTELAEFVTDLDPRVTYWPLRDTTIFDDTFKNQVSLISGSTVATVVVLGEETPNHVLGQLRKEFRITVEGAEQIRIDRLTLPTATETVAVPTTNGLTTPIELPGSSVKFRIQTGDTDNDLTDLVGTVWLLETRARPTQGLDMILSRLQTGLGPVPLLEFFGLGQQAPQQTLRNLWQTSPYLPYKLGALLLGLAYHTNELPSEPLPPTPTVVPVESSSSAAEIPAEPTEHIEIWNTGNIVDNIWAWTAPVNAVGNMIIECWGAGAIGGSGPSSIGARGGGGGAYSKRTLAISPGTYYSGFIGRGLFDGLGEEDNTTYVLQNLVGIICYAEGGIVFNGGEAAAGVGDVKREGGDGADQGTFSFPAGNGGGGGSGAGPDANGIDVPNGTDIGAAAPVGGGGKGGDGGVSPGAAQAGADPGGGGGGAHGQNGTPGNGGRGRIKITYYTQD